jgi:hypothetical protein
MATDPRFAEVQRAREQAMAPFVAEVGADGVFEVIEVVEELGPDG